MSKLKLHDIYQAPRAILSGVVQLRTGHGRFGVYFRKMNITEESLYCACGAHDTIDHSLLNCPLTQQNRHFLGPYSIDTECLASVLDWRERSLFFL
ncbi:hypothetical protein V1514DRAFT_336131 [Lipomyces japonicus]|uniref:uncharacterized protein n=1 Tax=Lipomyces japonicus TaxID=56871 RepID=UPI0034CF6189